MTAVAERQLMNACRTLFGPGVSLSNEFLRYLQPSGAKSAFRQRAKEHHPDRFLLAPAAVRQQQTERFREIHQAYRLLERFLGTRSPQPAQAPPVAGPRSTPEPAAGEPVSRPVGAPIPFLPLEFGLFAYYRGKISYQDLIAAVVWQRQQRPTIGALAVRWGWLTESAVKAIIRHPATGQRFGDKAQALGYLTNVQIRILLRRQQHLQQRIGQYFVQQGLLSEAEVERLVVDLERHNRRVQGNPWRTAG